MNMITSPAEKLVARAAALLAAINRGAARYGLPLSAPQVAGVINGLDLLQAEIAELRTSLIYALFEEPAKDPTSTDAA